MTTHTLGSTVRIFASMIDVKAWAGLHRRALASDVNATRESAWKPVDDADAPATPFEASRVVVVGHLTPEEIARVAGCLGYALRATLAGEELGVPVVSYVIERGRVTATIMEMSYDSATSIRTEPDPALAFELARHYVAEGTPCRKTGQTGPVGTRLVEGTENGR